MGKSNPDATGQSFLNFSKSSFVSWEHEKSNNIKPE
jgi:hypothetical protein